MLERGDSVLGLRIKKSGFILKVMRDRKALGIDKSMNDLWMFN